MLAVELPYCSLMKQHTGSARIRQRSCPIRLQTKKGRCAMARIDFGSLPRGNPCAQCGKPIAVPEWVEAGPGRTCYLWRCRACDYRFEAMAFFAHSEPEALAA
jgi:hypothetical protein